MTQKESYRCPTCGRRLFDIDEVVMVKLTIKCPRCKNTSSIHIDSRAQQESDKVKNGSTQGD